MPQLDQVTYLSQFFWLCFFYLTFYVVLLKSFLPKMNRILRFRTKIHQASSDSYVGEYQSLLQKSHTIRVPEIRSSSNHLAKVMANTRNWVDSTFTQYQRTNQQSTTMNQMYIRSIGEMAMTHHLMAASMDLVFPPIQSTQNAGEAKQKLFAHKLISRLKPTSMQKPTKKATIAKKKQPQKTKK